MMRSVMGLFWRLAEGLARGANGDPATTTVATMLFWLMLNILMAQIEVRIWGERFEHFFDLVLACLVIGFSALCVVACGDFHARLREGEQ